MEMILEVTAKDKIIQEGYDAYWNEPEGDNPYDEFMHEPQHKLWLYGFYNAADEDGEG
jgi:hypothetical protein